MTELNHQKLLHIQKKKITQIPINSTLEKQKSNLEKLEII